MNRVSRKTSLFKKKKKLVKANLVSVDGNLPTFNCWKLQLFPKRVGGNKKTSPGCEREREMAIERSERLGQEWSRHGYGSLTHHTDPIYVIEWLYEFMLIIWILVELFKKLHKIQRHFLGNFHGTYIFIYLFLYKYLLNIHLIVWWELVDNSS